MLKKEFGKLIRNSASKMANQILETSAMLEFQQQKVNGLSTPSTPASQKTQRKPSTPATPQVCIDENVNSVGFLFTCRYFL